jgi:hypothetical protein
MGKTIASVIYSDIDVCYRSSDPSMEHCSAYRIVPEEPQHERQPRVSNGPLSASKTRPRPTISC